MSVQTSAGTVLTHAVKPGCADSWVCFRKEWETTMTSSPRLPAGFVCDAAEPGRNGRWRRLAASMTLLRIDAIGPTELPSALGVVIGRGHCGVITPGSR